MDRVARRWLCRVGVTGLVIAAAGCSYRPGAFAYGMKVFPGTRATVGCLDVAVDRRADYDGNAVLAYRFGNRCEGKQVIDLGSARVIGRDMEGNEHVLAPFDPNHEIRQVPIDARIAGGETLAYSAGHQLAQVCVDVASLTRQRQPERWLCFARTVDPTPVPINDLRTPNQKQDDEEDAAPNRTLIEDEAREARL